MKYSSGLVLHRKVGDKLFVFLVHPGGPFWRNRDLGSWSIPKGEFTGQEDALKAARREFREEIGFDVDGEFVELTPVRQNSGKIIYAWALEYDFDIDKIISNTFEIEWPPGSGTKKKFPEVDRAEWFSMEMAFEKIIPGQKKILEELLLRINT
jgi:predicted NUDIX family NTP pyrophosphohydrolase